MPTREQLESAVQMACDSLKQKDRSLFERKVNERSLSHKFALYLQQEVARWEEGWEVDCEFNRDAKDTGEDYAKRLQLLDKLDSLTTSVWDEHAKTVFPDVIVHKRAQGENLLVVELKKDTASKKDRDFDQSYKLPAYVDQLGYRSAVFVLLKMDAVDCKLEWVKHLN